MDNSHALPQGSPNVSDFQDVSKFKNPLLMFFLVIVCMKLSNTETYFCQLSALSFKIFPNGEFHNLEVWGFP